MWILGVGCVLDLPVPPWIAEDTAKVSAPIVNSKLPSGHEWTQLEVLDPVSVVRYMVDSGLKIDMKAVRKFWDHHRSVNSPWIVQTQATRDHVPLGLFGDAVKFRQKSYGKPEKMLAVFLNAPLWRPKLARASRWLLFAIRENDLYEHKTLDCIFHYLVWRLNVLHDGTFPITGRSGEPLTGRDRERAGQAVCNGLRFAITELRGDWLYHRQVFRMRSTWLSGKKAPVCYLCPAYNTGPCSWLQLEDSSPLWDKQYTLAEWLVDQCPPDPSHSVHSQSLQVVFRF